MPDNLHERSRAFQGILDALPTLSLTAANRMCKKLTHVEIVALKSAIDNALAQERSDRAELSRRLDCVESGLNCVEHDLSHRLDVVETQLRDLADPHTNQR